MFNIIIIIAFSSERRIIKNWFSNQRALRRKTGQGYRGWATGSASSHSASGSGDELELEPELKFEVRYNFIIFFPIIPFLSDIFHQIANSSAPRRQLKPVFPQPH